MSRVAVDTNVLVHLYDDAGSGKLRRAEEIVAGRPTISPQVVSEYLNVTRLAAGPAEGAGPGPVQPGFLIVRNHASYPRHPGPCRPPAGPLRLPAYSTPSSWPRRWKRTATCCTRPTSSIISSSRAACGCSTRFGSAAAGGAAFPGGWWCRRVWRRTGSFAHALPQAICGQKPQCGGKAHTGHVALGSNMV